MQVQNRQDDLGTVAVATTGDITKVTVSRQSKSVSYGFGLGTTTDGRDVHVVTSVNEGGPADGVLEVTDMIDSINGEDARNLSHQAVMSDCRRYQH